MPGPEARTPGRICCRSGQRWRIRRTTLLLPVAYPFLQPALSPFFFLFSFSSYSRRRRRLDASYSRPRADPQFRMRCGAHSSLKRANERKAVEKRGLGTRKGRAENTCGPLHRRPRGGNRLAARYTDKSADGCLGRMLRRYSASGVVCGVCVCLCMTGRGCSRRRP